jgi:hypothetical protein
MTNLGPPVDAMALDPTWLFVSLIPAGIGFVLLAYGRKRQRWPYLVAGLLFTVFPYFTTSLMSLVGTGVVLGAALWWTIQLDW